MLYSKHSFPFSKASLQTDAALQEEGQTSTFEKVLPKPAEVVLEGEVFFFFAVRHDANNQGILYLWLLEIGKKSRTPPRPHSAEMAKP